MSNTTTLSPCIVLTWSADTADTRNGSLYLCSIAIVIHAIFWIQFLFYSSVRQRGMIWLYIYLLTDLFLIFRFFLFYGQRISNICVPRTARTYLCYFEATTKIYTNIIQSYILLGLNVSRYIQIVYNRNVYIKNIRLLILANVLIYILPMLNIAIQFVINATTITKQLGGLCDINYVSIYVELYNLIIVYVIPVSLNILFLYLCFRHINATGNIHNQQILNNRRKYNRTILTQSILFYTVWILLWSPFVISFEFININSSVGVITSLINYVQVAIDPVIVAVIDIRFLKAWKKTFRKIVSKRQRQIQATATTTVVKKY